MDEGIVMKFFRYIFAVAVIYAFSGCASVAVKDEDIRKRTSFALGMDAKYFKISNRNDDGMRTEYLVTTTNGAKYNCYIAGTFSITGKVVSDAVCSKLGNPNGRVPTSKAGPCNDLLRAAGRCK